MGETAIEETTTAGMAGDVFESPKEIRDRYRATLVGNTPIGETKVVMFHGIELELHTPTLNDIIGHVGANDPKKQVTHMIIKYAYIPGTDTPIFEDADAPQILKWPFDADWQNLQDTITGMMGVDIAGQEAAIKSDPLDEPS